MKTTDRTSLAVHDWTDLWYISALNHKSVTRVFHLSCKSVCHKNVDKNRILECWTGLYTPRSHSVCRLHMLAFQCPTKKNSKTKIIWAKMIFYDKRSLGLHVLPLDLSIKKLEDFKMKFIACTMLCKLMSNKKYYTHGMILSYKPYTSIF